MPKKWWLKTVIVKSHKETYDSKENTLVKKDSDNWFEEPFLARNSSLQNIQILVVFLRIILAQCLREGWGDGGPCLNSVVPLLAVWPVTVPLSLLVQVSSFIIKKTIITIATEDGTVSRCGNRHHPHTFSHLKGQVHKITIKNPQDVHI